MHAIEGQRQVLKKYGLKEVYEPNIVDSENLKRIIGLEGKYAQHYYKQIFSLFPEKIRPIRRFGFKAQEGVNNIFNLCYKMLGWKIHFALLKAKLEPYLGFLHSQQYGKPSLVCDFQELYRYLIDDFLIERCQKYHKNDFVIINERFVKQKYGKRIYLCGFETKELHKSLEQFFEQKVEIPRIKHGKKQTLDTLINEESLLFGKFLRDERKTWIPRIPPLC
jgi:CRISPR-associated protein Cas1